MSEQLRFLVAALNKPPFSKSLNLISFDSLEPVHLLQILNDVISAIEDEPTFDILNEPAEETAMRLTEALRILRYKLPVDPTEIQAFRIDLVSGDKMIIYPILIWLLQRIPELQKRAYLAKFLIQVYIPPEFQSDPDVQQLLNKCNNLMVEFQNAHKAHSIVKSVGMNSEEIRQDIRMMEEERDQLMKRTEKLKRKIDTLKNKDEMLKIAKLWRTEAEREAQLLQQKQEQRNFHVHCEQRMQRIQQQIVELRQQIENVRPEELIKSLEEENKIHKYMAEEKLPKEIEAKRKAVQELQKVAAMPAMDANDVEEIREKLNELNAEITAIVESKNLNSNPADDKLAIFRQQATIVQRKKETAAENLQELRTEAHNIENELKQKKSQMLDSEGNEIVTNVQFKNYVTKLRSKTNLYKKKRSELQDLAAEIGVLTRTAEILKGKMSKSVDLENETFNDLSVTSDNDFSDKRRDLKFPALNLTDKSPDEISAMVKELNVQIERKKNQLAPLLHELRPLREQFQKLSNEHATKKQAYDTKFLNLSSANTKVQQEVTRLKNEINEIQTNVSKLEKEKADYETFLEKAKYDQNFGDKLISKLAEAEDTNRKLKEEQKSIKESEKANAKEIKAWKDMTQLMECKIQCWQDTYGNQISAASTDRNVRSSDAATTKLTRPGSSRGSIIKMM